MSKKAQTNTVNKHCRRVLIIGSSGGIAQALIKKLLLSKEIDEVHAVSRTPVQTDNNALIIHQVDSVDEQAVDKVCQGLKNYGEFSLIICCIGRLHGGTESPDFQPEKRLESLNAEQMQKYFQINTLAPMHWLKHAVKLLPKKEKSHLVFFTARVASIQDNYLGGWYGYRASKAALNMLIKTAQVEYARRLPEAVLVSYHPGTVDTDLSKPFQKNVPDEKLFSAEFTVEQLLTILPSLSQENSPHYIDWQGKRIDW